MSKKQKKILIRIIVTALVYLVLTVIKSNDWIHGLEEFPVGLYWYVLPYLLIGWDVLYKAARNIVKGQVFDENFLMSIATFGAFATAEYPEAVAVMLFYQIGELFQDYAVNRSRQSIAELMDICPEYANIEVGGQIRQVDPDDIAIGDVILIKAGERIPLDGVVISGKSLVDTSALTGESVPRRVSDGSEIISGCVNLDGALLVKVTKTFDDSTVAKILELVENASSRKARVENFITKFARYYTPLVVIGAVLLALMPPLISGGDWGEWLRRACIFLVISCPCALVISVPLSFFGGIGAASKNGVLVKGSNYLEALSEMRTIVFDKTGTLTKGEFKVSEVRPVTMEENQLLELAALVEGYSNHPIAKSIKEAYGREADIERVKEVRELPGHGVQAVVDGKGVLVGNAELMKRMGVPHESIDTVGTVVYVACEKVYSGAIIIEDAVKEGAHQAILELRAAGVKRTVMLTGDKRQVGEAVASELELDDVYAELLPGDKVSKVEGLLETAGEKEKLAFVGDGINDAPVLTRADIGIAMGSMGSDAAIEAADIVLMDDDISKIALVVRIARGTLRIVKQNIGFALGVKALVMILGVFGAADMWIAVFADVGVSVVAILNAMRALRIK